MKQEEHTYPAAAPFQNILANIRRFAALKPEEEQALCALMSIKKLKKKEFLLREGAISTDEYYVNSGCLRQYFSDAKGLEHNLYFAIEDWWISDLHSRTQSVPANCSIIALEDCELVKINQAALEDCMIKIPALERFYRISYQQALVTQHLRSLQMLHMSGEERYAHFREKYPEMAKRIPQKHVATFLGLTPEFFNLIHARVLRSK